MAKKIAGLEKRDTLFLCPVMYYLSSSLKNLPITPFSLNRNGFWCSEKWHVRKRTVKTCFMLDRPVSSNWMYLHSSHKYRTYDHSVSYKCTYW